MLTNLQIAKIMQSEKVVFTTCNKKCEPRSIYVIPSQIESKRIILSNIQMQTSIKNVLENNKVFINAYLEKENDLQIKIIGRAKVFDKGALFAKIKKYEEEHNLPENLKVNSIIVIDIKSVEETNG